MEIDLRKLIASKSPLLARTTPRPIYRWLERILHLREVNYILTEHADLPPAEFIRAAMRDMGVTWRIEGIENLERGGRYVLASNHPFGGLDGVILAQAVEVI